MTIFEAMRLGAILKPQTFEFLRADGKSCALGAVADALGLPHEDNDTVYHKLTLEFPQLTEEQKCPACSLVRGWYRRWREKEFDLGDVVIHLNDDHHWTRERIADWLAARETPAVSGALAARLAVEKAVGR